MYPNKSFVCSNKCLIWKHFPVQMLSKVPIFSGLNQGLEVAEGQGMFFQQYYISCKKKKHFLLLSTRRAPLKKQKNF